MNWAPAQAAQRLIAGITNAPGARRVVGVVGVHGTGKTSLLETVAMLLRDAGVAVYRDLDAYERDAARENAHPAPEAAERPERASHRALVVDDAHRLSNTEIVRIMNIASDDDGPSVYAAYRDRPLRHRVYDLPLLLESHDAPVILGALTAAETQAWVRQRTGRELDRRALERLVNLTHGWPWLISRLIDLCDDSVFLSSVDESIVAGSLPDGGTHAAALERAIDRAIDESRDELVQRLSLELGRLDGPVHTLALALAVGFDLATLTVPMLEHFEGRTLDDVVAEAREAGLLDADDRLVPLIGVVIMRSTPSHRIGELRLELLEALSSAGRPLDGLTVSAISDPRFGLQDRRIADALIESGDELLRSSPKHAVAHYDAALSAGADADAVRVRLTQAALAAGDLGRAGALLERHFADEKPTDLVRAVEAAAAYWAMRGMPHKSAAAYEWLGADGVGDAAPTAAVAFFGAGKLEEARRMLEVPLVGFPMATAVSARMSAEGLHASLSSDPASALPLLMQASATLTAAGTAQPLPELPAVLAALVALHNGDPITAARLLDAAIASRQGGEASRPRLRLVRAWAAMLTDDIARAHTEHTEALREATPLAPRDTLFAVALEVALARHADDLHGLTRAWERVRDVILTVEMGLFTLLPLGELVIAAARMRDDEALEPVLADAWDVLHGLGDPPLWSSTLHWSCVQAGIIRNAPDSLGSHAAALVRASPGFAFAAVLAAGGRCWVRVLANQADVAEVEATARRLARSGLPWDAARLAGHAAGRATARKDMLRLLQTARELRSSATNGVHTPPQERSEPVAPMETETRDGERAADRAQMSEMPQMPAKGSRARTLRRVAAGSGSTDARAREAVHARAPGAPADESTPREALSLSAREREVVELVLDGRTYAEIGAALFISPRTAEHHIARIRRRTGAGSRSELLDHLRGVLG